MVTRMTLSTIITLLVTVDLAGADSIMHCGNSSVKLGERPSLSSGIAANPSPNCISNTIDQKEGLELLIEEWIHGPRDSSCFYIITFVGGRVSQTSFER